MSFRARRQEDGYNDSYRNIESVEDPRKYDEELQRYNKDNEDEPEVYIVRQRFGYMSILFSVLQTLILGIMMWQCGIAPLNLNPMVGECCVMRLCLPCNSVMLSTAF